MKSKRHIVKHHIHSRILFQLAIFSIVSLILLAIIISDVIQGDILFLWPIGGIIAGLAIGLAVGRIYAIKWHKDTQKVVASMDKTSIVLIVVYIILRFGSDQILGKFLQGEELTILTFSLLDGVMIGRMFGMSRNVIRVLKEQHLL